MQNFTPQWSLQYPSYPAPNSMQLSISLFLLLFLSTNLEVLNLSSEPHMSTTAMWQSRCTSLQACKLSRCLSRLSHFKWTFDSVCFWVKRNLLCLGSRGGRLRKRTAAHSRKRLLEIHLLQGKRISLLRCTWGWNTNQGALSQGPDLQMLWEKLPKKGKKKAGVQKSCALSRVLAKDEKGFAFIVLFYSLVLFQSILCHSDFVITGLVLGNKWIYRLCCSLGEGTAFGGILRCSRLCHKL